VRGGRGLQFHAEDQVALFAEAVEAPPLAASTASANSST
jgi:hypothetical protein